MKIKQYVIAAIMLGVGVSLVMGIEAVAQENQVQSLRGRVAIDEAAPTPELFKQNIGKPFARAYRQQPPLIPHPIAKYQINRKVNQCLRCHDWPYNSDEGAPKVSETHYFNRVGVALDIVSPTRWFCTQCHVPQMQTRTLVGNKFKSAFDME